MSALGPHPALMRNRSADTFLCQLVTEWGGSVPAGGAIVEPKEDGMRCLWIDGELVSREGSPIYGCEHIAAKLRAMEHEACRPMFFDGELAVDRSFAATVAHFQAAGARGDAGTLHLFDMTTMDTWRGNDVCEALHARKSKLARLAEGFEGEELRVMPWAYMENAADIRARAAELIAAGGEGVVVKHAFATYRRTKSSEWGRIRRSITLDVPVVGVTPHRSLAGRLGALVVEVDGVRARVHHGFTDRERIDLWEARDRLPGAIVEVEAMDRTDRGSLRQAVFVRMREDKRRCTPTR